jgi:hypothetical protein
MAGIGKSARQAGAFSAMASLKACMVAGRRSILRLRLAVVPAVLTTLALPAAALGNGALPGATVPDTSALVGAATTLVPEPTAPQTAEALAEKPVSPPEPPALPPPDVTSAPVVKAPTPVNAPEPAPPNAVTPQAGSGGPVDSVANVVKEPVRKVDAVAADPVGTTTKVVQDVQKDASNLAGLIGGGGPPAPPDLVGTTTYVVQDVQKDASNLTGLIGGGGPLVPPDLVGTATNVVQDVQKDASNLTGLIGDGGPGTGVPQLSPTSELLPASDLLSNLIGIVYADATILEPPVRPIDGAVEQTASVWKSPQSPFPASSFEPRQPPPGAPSGGSLPGGGSPSAVGSGPPAWDAAVSDSAQGTGAIPAGDRSPPAGRNSAGGGSSVSSRSLAGVHGGIVSPALERSGGTFPPMPSIPPMPKLPAMGSGAVSTSLLFGLASALAVMLALAAARSGSSRRFALGGERPVGFARLLEQPG